MKNTLLAIFLFFGTTSYAAKYYCSMPKVQFRDSSQSPLYYAYLSIIRSGQTNIPVTSYVEYLNLYQIHCRQNNSVCQLNFNTNLNTGATNIYVSNISYTDCQDRLLRPAETISQICDKTYFTSQNLNSAKRAPEVGQIEIHFSRTHSGLRQNPIIRRYTVGCQYF